MKRRPLAALAGAVALTVPWIAVTLLGIGGRLAALPTVVLSGPAVLGTAFLLAWAAETAEKDVPRAFAIAVLAVLAVAPEYAVDALYAWEAGQFAGTTRGLEASNLAVANMTGANRILIGLGWSGIVAFTILRRGADEDSSVVRRSGFLRDAVRVDPDISLDIVFLGLATAWAFTVPMTGGINIVDTAVLVGLYVAYISVIIRGDIDHEENVGVPRYLQSLRKRVRIPVVIGLFVFSLSMLLIAVKPFAHGLESLGTAVGLPEFFMIQWVAPLASESPELIVVAYLVTKARSTAGFNALVSSKLNQWTLLIGTLVVVYSLALGQYGALPFDRKQAGEIWLTAAQSLFAIALLVDLEFSLREAALLFALFSSQVLIEFALVRGVLDVPFASYDVLIAFSVVYVLLGAANIVRQRGSVRALLDRTVSDISAARRPDAEGLDRAD
ncbi:MAG: sodium:calcium antiporter [Haloferacaceae archaeon]